MSATGTRQRTAPKSSGRWIIDRADEQPAVAAAFDRDPLRRRVALGDQALRGGDEVVEDVLLLLEHARRGATSSPYSPPPRRFASAKTPPRSRNGKLPGSNAGVRLMLNPP